MFTPRRYKKRDLLRSDKNFNSVYLHHERSKNIWLMVGYLCKMKQSRGTVHWINHTKWVSWGSSHAILEYFFVENTKACAYKICSLLLTFLSLENVTLLIIIMEHGTIMYYFAAAVMIFWSEYEYWNYLLQNDNLS